MKRLKDLKNLINKSEKDNGDRFDSRVSCSGFVYEIMKYKGIDKIEKEFVNDFCNCGNDCNECELLKKIKIFIK